MLTDGSWLLNHSTRARCRGSVEARLTSRSEDSEVRQWTLKRFDSGASRDLMSGSLTPANKAMSPTMLTPSRRCASMASYQSGGPTGARSRSRVPRLHNVPSRNLSLLTTGTRSRSPSSLAIVDFPDPGAPLTRTQRGRPSRTGLTGPSCLRAPGAARNRTALGSPLSSHHRRMARQRYRFLLVRLERSCGDQRLRHRANQRRCGLCERPLRAPAASRKCARASSQWITGRRSRSEVQLPLVRFDSYPQPSVSPPADGTSVSDSARPCRAWYPGDVGSPSSTPPNCAGSPAPVPLVTG